MQKFDIQEAIDKLLDKYNSQRLNNEGMDYPNRPTNCSKISQ
jgi:hypothetical protein